jgi:hypothetical protein
VSDRQDNRFFSQTKAGQKLLRSGVGATRLFKTGKSVVIVNGDTCRPGQVVVVKGNHSHNLARLEEILQEVDSVAYNQGKADALLVQTLDITGTSERLRMPQLSTGNNYILMKTEVSNVYIFLFFHLNKGLQGCSLYRKYPARM